MTPIHSFSPIADVSARALILGSMPGQASLRAGEYYAHPRNVFWKLMGELFGADPALPYTVRAQQLRASGIALWDVLAACRRTGSLDSAIDKSSITANDFSTFFAIHHNITHVFFNGTTAERCFRVHVLPILAECPLQIVRLPSTSPAHAALDYAQKRAAWTAVAHHMESVAG